MNRKIDFTEAGIFFEKYSEYMIEEDKLRQEILRISGDMLASCCEDIIFDEYDYSFEIKGAVPSFIPTEDQVKKYFDLGFGRFWVCYSDGTEKYYSRP